MKSESVNPRPLLIIHCPFYKHKQFWQHVAMVCLCQHGLFSTILCKWQHCRRRGRSASWCPARRLRPTCSGSDARRSAGSWMDHAWFMDGTRRGKATMQIGLYQISCRMELWKNPNARHCLFSLEQCSRLRSYWEYTQEGRRSRTPVGERKEKVTSRGPSRGGRGRERPAPATGWRGLGGGVGGLRRRGGAAAAVPVRTPLELGHLSLELGLALLQRPYLLQQVTLVLRVHRRRPANVRRRRSIDHSRTVMDGSEKWHAADIAQQRQDRSYSN